MTNQKETASVADRAGWTEAKGRQLDKIRDRPAVTVYSCPNCAHPMKWGGETWHCRVCQVWWTIKIEVQT